MTFNRNKAIRDFNSHAHVERDALVILTTVKSDISTHTLTWSVTTAIAYQFQARKFQLTRSRGA